MSENLPANVAHYRHSTDAASICKGIVVASAMTIQNRRYVQVEGWQAIAVAHGCTASACNVERVEGGYRAIGQIRRMADGIVIAEAEGFVGEDEPTWFGGEVTTKWGTKQLPKRSDYAIRAMAQTRAISRACRSAFAHVIVMMNAGLETTPAEEMMQQAFDPPQEPTNKTLTKRLTDNPKGQEGFNKVTGEIIDVAPEQASQEIPEGDGPHWLIGWADTAQAHLANLMTKGDVKAFWAQPDVIDRTEELKRIDLNRAKLLHFAVTKRMKELPDE